MKEYIGIDLGSNSLRCVRMNKDFEVLGEYEETIRTAEGLEENKVIGEAALGRIIKALKKAKEVLKRKIDDVEITENTSEDDSRETISNKNKKLKQDNNIEVQKSVSPTLNEHNSESENNENGINEQLLNKDIKKRGNRGTLV